MNFTGSILKKAASVPRNPALVFGGTTYSYRDLAAGVEQYADLLAWLGVKKGDRVAVQLPNCAEFVFLHLATMLLGAITLPLNTGYRWEEIEYFLQDSGSRLFFVDGDGSGQPVWEMEGNTKIRIIASQGEHANSLTSLLDESRKNKGAPVVAGQTRGDDTALLCYTSGTTGKPKGAMITHRNLLSNTAALKELWRWSEDDVLLCVLPMFHIHGLCVALHGALNASAKIIIQEKFDPAGCLLTIEKSKCTMFMAVPTIYYRLMELWPEQKCDLSSMRLFVSGSAPLSGELFSRFLAATGFRILERYGMTETQMIASNPYEEEKRIPQSVGYPLPGIKVRVCTEAGADVKPGEVGEVLVKGDNVFRGYWQMPEKTKDSFSDGWFKTGDLGYQDAGDEKRLYLKGRAKELIISGGYNVYPKEVEDVLARHESVRESAVFGISDPEFGEKVTAAVVLKEDSRRSGAATEAVLLSFCKEKLASYKCPKVIIFLDELPRNAMGKIQKHLITNNNN